MGVGVLKLADSPSSEKVVGDVYDRAMKNGDALEALTNASPNDLNTISNEIADTMAAPCAASSSASFSSSSSLSSTTTVGHKRGSLGGGYSFAFMAFMFLMHALLGLRSAALGVLLSRHSEKRGPRFFPFGVRKYPARSGGFLRSTPREAGDF